VNDLDDIKKQPVPTSKPAEHASMSSDTPPASVQSGSSRDGEPLHFEYERNRDGDCHLNVSYEATGVSYDAAAKVCILSFEIAKPNLTAPNQRFVRLVSTFEESALGAAERRKRVAAWSKVATVFFIIVVLAYLNYRFWPF
jgi:hypothetical protein